ncbi:MAG: acrD [Cytophagaceae bacterium]|jgi:multidrug efflux pump subunit AcrB|nr:acrD [Cytophagaceae bacterium]
MKEFKLTSWSIDNRTSIYVLTVIITLAGLVAYINLPKEQFPEIVFPQMYVSTIYPGTSPTDMENLVTKQIEKQVKSISGVKKVTSNSVQDFSSIIVEFNTDVDIADAKTKVKDAVDKAKNDLPTDLPDDPQVIEIDVSQIPIMFVHISGDYELSKLKKYADDMQDRIEALPEITRVDLVGAPEREIQINVDRYKMEAAGITLSDVERAVRYENMTISGGLVKMDELKRSVSIKGEFTEVAPMNNIVLRSSTGAQLYLKDILEEGGVKDTYEEKESFARLNKKNVITLNVIKRSGENLIEASDKIIALVDDMKKNSYPAGLNVTITGDQSDATRTTVDDLINTIIIGFILVVIILMFFMGATNAIFVGMSVPLSMFIAFLLLPSIGFTLNMIVLFAFLLALGIVVDDAIVVVENTHRIYDNGKVPIVQAAKSAAGEVFLPVFSGTMTTLAPFVPLAFWSGVIGKFMFFLPVTLIITLTASLIVAYIINPVFAVDFMKPHDEHGHKKMTKGTKITLVIMGAIALLFYINAAVNGSAGAFGMGNFILLLVGLFLLNKYFLEKVIKRFQDKTWPSFQNMYVNVLEWCLKSYRPIWLMVATVGLLIGSFILTGIVQPKVVFFPTADPNFVYTYITLPIGTDQVYTDSVTSIVEDRVTKAVSINGKPNPAVSSIISNVAVGASEDEGDLSTSPNKGKVTVAFVKYADRNGISSAVYLDKVREAVKDIPGVQISVNQEQGGPPTGKPVNIEIAGDDYNELIAVSERLKKFINQKGIRGIEELKSDVLKNKPEVVIEIDRQRANAEGISTGQVGSDIRSALFGKEVSKFRDANDEYDIELRYRYDQRHSIDDLLNTKITFRDMNMNGAVRQIPLSSVAKVRYGDTFGGIKRKNQKRVVTLYSNVLSEYNANDINAAIKRALPDFALPSGVSIDMTGEQEEQAETGAFLVTALMVSLGLIFLILVTQFNSVSKPVIILTEIVFSIIGVLLGFCFTGMAISIIMTGIGIVALAGIVVRNGILLVEFIEYREKDGVGVYDAILEAGRTRMTPVLMTASATMLGLIPLAIGFNINFVKMFTHLEPHIHFGGDSGAFWGPLAWTMIFGLFFATFLTLVLVPVMYLLVHKLKQRLGMKVNEHKSIMIPGVRETGKKTGLMDSEI